MEQHIINNFNGIKDILPILQKNIPRALGANRGIFEILKSEAELFPIRFKQMQNALQKLSEDELRVHINSNQIEYIEQKYKKRLKKERLGWILILMSIAFYLNIQTDIASLLLFGFGSLILLEII